MVEKELIVATAEKGVSSSEVQPAGKPKMDIASFLNGVGRTLAVENDLVTKVETARNLALAVLEDIFVNQAYPILP